MSAWLTDYYDPDDPPRPTRMDEADRLLGKAVGRSLWFFLYLIIVGGDPWNGLLGLLDTGGYRLVLGILIAAYGVVPLCYGVEHIVLDAAEYIRGGSA